MINFSVNLARLSVCEDQSYLQRSPELVGAQEISSSGRWWRSHSRCRGVEEFQCELSRGPDYQTRAEGVLLVVVVVLVVVVEEEEEEEEEYPQNYPGQHIRQYDLGQNAVNMESYKDDIMHNTLDIFTLWSGQFRSLGNNLP